MRSKHPSGRPIHRRVVIKRRCWNIPDEGCVTPRLKPPESNTEAIGFTAHFDYEDEGE